MSINGGVDHVIWRDHADPKIIRIRCGHLEIPMKRKPIYCPYCGEYVEPIALREFYRKEEHER